MTGKGIRMSWVNVIPEDPLYLNSRWKVEVFIEIDMRPLSFFKNIKMLTTSPSPIVIDLVRRQCARRKGIVTVLSTPRAGYTFTVIERLGVTGLSFLLRQCTVP
jgi:hypothetical protein